MSEQTIPTNWIFAKTEMDGMLVNDCKLSRLGYGLVLLNEEVHNPIVARWQIQVMRDFLK